MIEEQTLLFNIVLYLLRPYATMKEIHNKILLLSLGGLDDGCLSLFSSSCVQQAVGLNPMAIDWIIHSFISVV
jgi:hypothetical protein